MSSIKDSLEPKIQFHPSSTYSTLASPTSSRPSLNKKENTAKDAPSRPAPSSSRLLASDILLSLSHTTQLLHSILPKLVRWRFLIFYQPYYVISGRCRDPLAESRLMPHTARDDFLVVRYAVRFKANGIVEDVRGLIWQTIVSSTKADIEQNSTRCSDGVNTSDYESISEDANVLAFIRQMYDSYRTARTKLKRRYGISFHAAGEDRGWVRKLGLEMPPILKAVEEVSIHTTIPIRQFVRAWELYLKCLELKHAWNQREITLKQSSGRKLPNRAARAEAVALGRLSVVSMLVRWLGYQCLAESLIEDRKDIESCSAFDQETSDQSGYFLKDPRNVYLNAMRRCHHWIFDRLEEAYIIDSDRFHLRMGKTLKVRLRDEICKGTTQHILLRGYRDDRREGLTAWLSTVRLENEPFFIIQN